MATAYSYVRFSSEKQRHGASLERQLEAAARYAHTHSLVLDTSTYKDLGVSAFRSKNAEGALGAFLEAVDAKKIAKGSYLLVESLDRLSRDSVDVALELFLGITRRGIVIVTLMDQQVYSSATIKENWTRLIMALAVMARANEESVTKSKRAHDAIERRQKRGEIVTTRLPTWMEFSADRKSAKLIPARAAIIKQIFERTLKGEGARSLTRWLQAEKVPVLFYASEWRQSAVSQVLKNRAAFGEFKGVEGMLPAVITKEKWLRVQNITSTRRKWGSGTLKTQSNIFSGLGFCAMCGRRMRRVGSKHTHYLKCTGSTDLKNCHGRMFPLPSAETALVYELAHKSKANVGADFFREQNDKRSALENEIASNKERQKKLIQLAALAEGVDAVADELRRLQKHIDTLTNELNGLSAMPLSRQEMHESAALFGIYMKHADPEFAGHLKYGDNTKDLKDFRLKFKMLLARTVKRIDFWNGHGDNFSPTLIVTMINDKQTNIDVTPFLPARTLAQHANGIGHRKDMHVVKPKAARKK